MEIDFWDVVMSNEHVLSVSEFCQDVMEIRLNSCAYRSKSPLVLYIRLNESGELFLSDWGVTSDLVEEYGIPEDDLAKTASKYGFMCGEYDISKGGVSDSTISRMIDNYVNFVKEIGLVRE